MRETIRCFFRLESDYGLHGSQGAGGGGGVEGVQSGGSTHVRNGKHKLTLGAGLRLDLQVHPTAGQYCILWCTILLESEQVRGNNWLIQPEQL